MRRPRRTLAIDVTAKGFGYVLLEGRESLVDWGLAQVMPGNATRLRARVRKLLRRFEPELLVLEEPEGSRRARRARRLIKALSELAEKEDVAWCMVSRPQVEEAFGDPANKHEIARAVAELFPELEHRMPRKRTAWMSEDERMGIFDAASFALTVLGGLETPA
jgi:hypothetical protein